MSYLSALLAAAALAFAGAQGTLDATEAQDTASASGNVIVAGTMDATEAQDSTSFSGSVTPPQQTITGTLAATDAEDSFAASGGRKEAGTLSATDPVDTFAGSGNVIVAGTLSATDPQDSFASSGSVIVAGTLAATDQQDAFASTGEVRVVGTLDATDTADSFAASGIVKPWTVGTLAVTDQPDTTAITGAVTHAHGSLAATDQQDSLSADGSVIVAGTLAATDAQDSPTIGGYVGTFGGQTITGTLAATDAQDSLSGAGFAARNGVLAATGAADTATAAGSVTHAHGTLSVSDGQDTLAASGRRGQAGTLAATDPADSLAAAGLVIVEGALAAQDGQDVLAAAGRQIKLVAGDLSATEAQDICLWNLYHGMRIPGLVGATVDADAGEVAGEPSITEYERGVDDGATSVEVTAGVATEVSAFIAHPSPSVVVYIFNGAQIGYFPLYPFFRDFVTAADALRLSVTKRSFDGVYSEDIAATSARERLLESEVTATDDAVVAATFARRFTDSVQMQDAVSLSAGFTVSVSADGTAAFDALSRALAKALADAVVMVDLARPASAKLPTDSAGATDAIHISAHFRRSAADTATPTDQPALRTTKRTSDTAFTADGIARLYAKPLNDGASVADSARLRMAVRPAESAVPLDSLSYAMTYRRTLADSVTLSDDASVYNPGHIWRLDVAAMSDQISKATTRTLADSRPVVDAVSLTPRLLTGESVSAADSGTILHEGGYADDYFDADYTEQTLINF